MAGDYLLNCLEKRDLLNDSDVAESTLLTWGQRFEEAEMIHDAVDFYEKANSRENLDRLLRKALEDGDVFLFSRLCRILKYEAVPDQWLLLAGKAEAEGKHSFAVEAKRRSGTIEPEAGADRP